MAINRYDQFPGLDFAFSQTPLQPLMAALDQKQKRFDVYQAAADELSNQYIRSLPQDRARANAIQQGIQSKIDDMVTASGGDFSELGSQLYTLKRDISRTLSPGGEGYAIQQNLDAFTTADDFEKKRLAKGEITQEQYNLWRNRTLGNYQGIGEFDRQTGSYNRLQPDQLAAFVDLDEIGMEIAKEIEPMAESVEIDENTGAWIVRTKRGTEVIPPERIQQAVGNRLINHEGAMDYLNQLAILRGYTGDQIPQFMNQRINDIASNMALTFAQQNTEFSQTMKANPWAMQRSRQKSQEDLMNRLFGTTFGPAVQQGETPAKLTVDSLTRKPSSELNIAGAELRVGQAGGIGAAETGRARARQKQKQSTFNIAESAQNEEFIKSNNIYKPLLDLAIQRTPREQGESLKDYNNRVLDFYNENRSAAIQQPKVHPIQGEGVKEALKKTVMENSLLYGTANTRPETKGRVGEAMTFEETLDELGLSMNDVYDAEKGEWKLTPISIHSGQSPFAGNITLGLPSDPSVRIHIEDWSNEVNQAVAPFRDFQNVQHNEFSQPHRLPGVTDNDGNEIYATATKMFVPGPDGKLNTETVLYKAELQTDNQGNITGFRPTGERLDTNLGELSEFYKLPQLLGERMPLGAAKSDLTPFMQFN